MAQILLSGYRCERCEHEWVPREKDQSPRVCPKCKSPYWNQARKTSSKDPCIAPVWVNESIDLARRGKNEESLDVIFDNIDDLLLAGKSKECDAALMSIPVEQLNSAQLLTALTATAPARGLLHYRKKFFSRVEGTLRNRGANAATLLSGLA